MPFYLTNLTKARNELAHRVQDHIVETGLSASEYLVLMCALEDERATAAAIRQKLGMRQSTVTSLVARLVDRGYVRIEPARRDRRTRYLRPTLPGLLATRIARSIHRDLEALAMPYDRLKVYDGLRRLAFLTSILPQPVLMEDGLPEITA
jgi:DNA-binding MarR family transcriptional regulator